MKKHGKVLKGFTSRIKFFIIMSFFVFLCIESEAQETIKLKFSSPIPQNDPISIADIRTLDKIESESNGRIRFERYFGGTLIPFPKSVIEIKAGITDIGVCTLAVAPKGFEIQKALLQSLPAVKNSDEMRRINNEIMVKYPKLMEDWDTYGKPLAVSYPGPFQVGLKKSINKFDDLKGIKIKATRTHMAVMNKLGAEGIDLPSTEVYLALSKGTISGATMTQNQLKSLKFAEVVKYVVSLELFDPAGLYRVMNLKSWNKLPSDVQKMFIDIGEYWGKEGDKELTKVNNEALTYAEGLGVNFLDLPKSEMTKLYKITDSIIREKMSSLDNKGLPATEIYNEFYNRALQY